MRVVVLLFVVACAHGQLPERIRPTTPNARLIRQVLRIGSREEWQSTRWYRMEQDTIDWPRRVVLSSDDSVCLMDEWDVNEPQQGDYFACATAWRVARP